MRVCVCVCVTREMWDSIFSLFFIKYINITKLSLKKTNFKDSSHILICFFNTSSNNSFSYLLKGDIFQ